MLATGATLLCIVNIHRTDNWQAYALNYYISPVNISYEGFLSTKFTWHAIHNERKVSIFYWRSYFMRGISKSPSLLAIDRVPWWKISFVMLPCDGEFFSDVTVNGMTAKYENRFSIGSWIIDDTEISKPYLGARWNWNCTKIADARKRKMWLSGCRMKILCAKRPAKRRWKKNDKISVFPRFFLWMNVKE